MQRVTGLIEDESREIEQIESCLNQLGMADDYLHSLFELPCVPHFALRGIHIGAQDRRADSFITQNPLQAGSNIVLARVNGKDLAASALRQFLLDLFDQSAL